MKTVLIVDDSGADIELLVAAFERVSAAITVVVARDGDEGLAAIGGSKPDVVLVDLNMPRLPGLEMLRLVKADARMALTPLLVLSTSSSLEDRKRSIRAGARGYLVKPTTFEATVEMAAAIERFWRLAR
jgi:CheY-like chemotaxis protein